MRRLLRWTGRLALLMVALIAALLLPVGYVEVACRGNTPTEQTYIPILSPDHHRPEARTLLTYPEWHIVHAYDDYAEVIGQNDPHAYGFLNAIGGFWSSLCAVSQQSAQHGGFAWETKQMVYTIGVSFTAELLAKAAYEETIGRLFAILRGETRAPLDDISADQAAAYARFLQQVPWYKWDFRSDAQALGTASSGSLRDVERRIALGIEYRTKAAYAGLIEQAVGQVGADNIRLRMLLVGLSSETLGALPDVQVIETRPEGTIIETPRYRVLTELLQDMALAGADFVEIAGNDDILLTATSANPAAPGALHSFARQGYGDHRHLILLKVRDLATRLRTMQGSDLRLEHIHDY
ncbi:hypothetical protein G5B38_13155 [Pseudohalocynthiibacter aestuariivivens]|nr:hypothetical protein [Pseudohalocynthiibacter aestuariivivens]QIE46393.1 hypothetical protein G5B38_13155 [Pseudohalocynthiibacter aestuariivivens]